MVTIFSPASPFSHWVEGVLVVGWTNPLEHRSIVTQSLFLTLR